MEKEILKESNVAELDKEVNADDYFIYTKGVEEEKKKNIEKHDLNRPEGALEKTKIISGEIISEESMSLLLEILDIYLANQNKPEWEDFTSQLIPSLNEIFNNMVDDFEGANGKELFRYNLITKIKKVFSKLMENKFLKEFYLVFEENSKFFDKLVKRENEFLEQIKLKGEQNKRKLNEERRKKRQEADRKAREAMSIKVETQPNKSYNNPFTNHKH